MLGLAWTACTVQMTASLGAAAQERTSQERMSSQDAIERDFRSGDTGRVYEALEAFLRIPLEERSPGLRQALSDAVIQEMERERQDRRLGGDFERLVAAVAEIGRTGDTVVIPALLRFPRTGELFPLGGRAVYETLLALGEPALQGVVEALASDQLREEARGPALRALAYFVADWGPQALDRETYSAVRDHVLSALERPRPADASRYAPMTPVGTLVAAVQLGCLLGDEEVRAEIEELASGEAAVRARGITNPKWIARVQRSAVEGLADARLPWRSGVAQLEEDFRSEEGWRVMEALEAFLRLPRENRGPGIREALVDAVVLEAGRPPEERILDDVLQLGELLWAVADIANSGDTVAVRALALFPLSNAFDIYETMQRYDPAGDGPEPEPLLPGTWTWASTRLMLQLGDPALRGALRTVSSAKIDDEQYGAVLELLAHFVADRGASGFDDDTHAALVDRAVQALARPFMASSSPEFARMRLLELAMQLGVLLGDPEAVAFVEELARADRAVRARGIVDPVRVSHMRRTAREVLANPLPRFHRE